MTSEGGRGSFSVAVLNSHPIQYFAPLYRRLAAEPDIELTVYFGSRAGLDTYRDQGFGGETFAWDVPLVDGYDHLFVPNLRRKREPDGFWSLVNAGIVGELRQQQFDAVWIHGHAYAYYLLGVLGAKLAGSALFMRCETHMGLDRSLTRRTARRIVMPAFYRLFDACLAIGTRNAAFYGQMGVPEKKIFLVPYAVDNRRFGEGADLSARERVRVRRSLGLPDEPDVPVILFLSKLMSRKRPMDLVEAYARLRRESDPSAALAFVGEGSERRRLEGFVERHGVPDVHFLGFRNQSELPKVYGASDIFVLPSEDEPWGLVVNEAMCAGLPVIVTDEVGAAPDLVHEGENGYRFPVGDIDQLAAYLHWLVTDVDIRSRMGERSTQIVQQWDYDACVNGLRRALHATCGSPVDHDRSQTAARAASGSG